jgi:hypothetical protein
MSSQTATEAKKNIADAMMSQRTKKKKREKKQP